MGEERRELSDAALWERIALDLQEAVRRAGGINQRTAATLALAEAQRSSHWPAHVLRRLILRDRERDAAGTAAAEAKA